MTTLILLNNIRKVARGESPVLSTLDTLHWKATMTTDFSLGPAGVSSMDVERVIQDLPMVCANWTPRRPY